MNKTFSKPALAVISVLTIALILTLLLLIKEKNKDSKGNTGEGNITRSDAQVYTGSPKNTELIKVDSAKAYQNRYLANKAPLYYWDGDTDYVLHGFSIDVDSIAPILTHDSLETLHLTLALQPGAPNTKAYFTLILSGLTPSRNYIVNAENHPYLYEFLRPCPPNGNCPKYKFDGTPYTQ